MAHMLYLILSLLLFILSFIAGMMGLGVAAKPDAPAETVVSRSAMVPS